jgi:hypothetical protein
VSGVERQSRRCKPTGDRIDKQQTSPAVFLTRGPRHRIARVVRVGPKLVPALTTSASAGAISGDVRVDSTRSRSVRKQLLMAWLWTVWSAHELNRGVTTVVGCWCSLTQALFLSNF